MVLAVVLIAAGCGGSSSSSSSGPIPEGSAGNYYSFKEIDQTVASTGCTIGLTLNQKFAVESTAKEQPVASNPSRTAGVTYSPDEPGCYDKLTEALKALP